MAGRIADADVPWLIVAGDFSLNGGMDKANYHLAWSLAENRGRQVHLVTHRAEEPLASHKRVRVHAVLRPFGRHALGSFLLNRTGRHAAASLTAVHPGLRVIVNGGNCLWPGVNWIHMVHHACGCADEGAPCLFRLKNRLMQWLDRRRERRTACQSALLVANSYQTRRNLIDKLGAASERIKVVYLGVDPAVYRTVTFDQRLEARHKYAVPAETYTILFVGSLGFDRNKGFDTLLAACRRLQDIGQSQFMVLAAGGGALGFWQGEIDKLGLHQQVRLLGLVKEMPVLLAAADVLVSPTRYDAYGLAVHEALCRGVPAIVSRAAGISERYPAELSELLLDDPSDSRQLANSLSHGMMNSTHLRHALERFSEQLRVYSWEDMAGQMIDLVEGLTLPKPRSSGRTSVSPRA